MNRIEGLARQHGTSFGREYKACLMQGINIREADIKATDARKVAS